MTAGKLGETIQVGCTWSDCDHAETSLVNSIAARIVSTLVCCSGKCTDITSDALFSDGQSEFCATAQIVHTQIISHKRQ